MINAQTFSATPIPAEGISPSELTIAWMIMKEMPTSRSDTASGSPSLVIRVLMKIVWSTVFFIAWIFLMVILQRIFNVNQG